MKICKINILLALLAIFVFYFAKAKSITIFPYIPNNFYVFCCVVLIAVSLVILAILFMKKKSKKNFVITAIMSVVSMLCSVLFYYNIPFRRYRDEKVISLINNDIRISRYYIMFEQRIHIQYIPNMLYAKDIGIEIVPVSKVDLDECVMYEFQNNDIIEVKYTIEDYAVYTWVYNIKSEKMIDSFVEPL